MSGVEIFGLVSGIIGLLGTVFGVWTWAKGRRRRELTWSVEHNIILEGSKSKIPGLKIMFEDEEIPSLRSTVLTIKNTGNEDIVGEDILQPIQFSVGVETDQLLNVRLLNEDTIKPNKCVIKTEEGSTEFSFKYMSKKDYARIQILHTATGNPEIHFAEGTIIKDGRIVVTNEVKRVSNNTINLFFTIGFLCGITGLLGIAIRKLLGIILVEVPSAIDLPIMIMTIMALAGFLVLYFPIVKAISNGYKLGFYRKKGLPNSKKKESP